MQRIILCCLLILSLSGCGRHIYINPDRSAGQEEKDYYECRFDAEKSTGNLSSKDNRDSRVESMIESCMRARGYK